MKQKVAWITAIGVVLAIGWGWVFGLPIVEEVCEVRSHEALYAIIAKFGDGSTEYCLSRSRVFFAHLAIVFLTIYAFLLLFASRDWSINSTRLVGILVFSPVILTTLYFAVGFPIRAVLSINYPYILSYGEGNFLDNVLSLKHGLPLYTPFDEPPFTMVNYPPLYMLALVAFEAVVPLNDVAAGRMLSFLCTLATAFVIGCITWRGIDEHVDDRTRALMSVVAGLVFLSTYPVLKWGALIRADMLAALFACLGLLAFIETDSDERWLWVSILFFVLAGYTKQSFVEAPLACFVVGLWMKPSRALRLAIGVATFAAALFIALNAVTDGLFYDHVIWGNVSHGYSASRAAQFLGSLWRRVPLFLVVAIVGVLCCAWNWRKNVRQLRSSVPAAFWVMALLVSLTVGKEGSGYNYFITLMIATAIMVGIVTAGAWAAAGAGSFASFVRSPWRVALVLPLFFVVMYEQLSKTPKTHRKLSAVNEFVLGVERRAEAADVLERIRSVDGDVVSTDHLLPVLAGKRLFYETGDMMRFYDLGIVDQEPMLEMIRDREFPLIVLNETAHEGISGGGEPRGRITLEMQDAIRNHYGLVWERGSYFGYVPSGSD